MPMNKLSGSDGLIFDVHLIRISESPLDPTVRILLVATASMEAVYEGIGSWSTYSNWLSQFSHADIREVNLAAKKLKRSKYATLRARNISLFDLESLGLNRVDKLL